MITQQGVDAAMRVLTALITGGGPTDDADLFARTIIEAEQEAPGGFEELFVGLLHISQLLVDAAALGHNVTADRVLQILGPLLDVSDG